MKQRLIVSFSGGLTSAFMAHELLTKYSAIYELLFVFANTGQEWEQTLVFVDRCSHEWNIEIVWVEAVVSPIRGIGTSHRIVDFETASRNGEPFEAVIVKYGIPNKPFPHCTRELKKNTINSWRRSIGWGNSLMAIGIRADEPRRVRKDADKQGIIYPLVSMFPTIKEMVNDWWSEQPFKLGLLPHQGNCSWCWKKSTPKLLRIAKESRHVFDFPARMEEQYTMAGPSGQPQVFFRDWRSTKDLLQLADMIDSPKLFIEHEDEDAGCSESCEAFGGEDT